MSRNTVAEPTTTKSLVPDAVDRARNVSQFLDRVAGAVVEAQAGGGRSLSDRARQGRTLVGTVLRRRRLSPLAWSALLAIALPTLVGAVYYGLIATNQYASDVRFSIRGNDTSSADLFSGLSGMLGTSKSLQDSYLVSSYLTSREVVEDVDKKVPLRAIYTKPFIDYLSRLETDAPIDELVEYWQNMVTVAVDETSNTVSVEIRAFSAEDSKAIGIALVEASENLLNRISDRAREDAMRTSVAMSKETEKRVLAAREAFRQFRDQQGNLDPVTTAQSMLGMVSSLTQAKLLLEQDLATRRSSQGPNSPVVINLQTKLKTIEEQIRDFRSQVTEFGRTDQTTISAQMARAEALRLEQEYAEKTHASSLAAVDMARTEADRSRLFIIPFVRPAAAEEYRYPDRPLSILTVFLASAALWAIGTLLVYGIRDHMV